MTRWKNYLTKNDGIQFFIRFNIHKLLSCSDARFRMCHMKRHCPFYHHSSWCIYVASVSEMKDAQGFFFEENGKKSYCPAYALIPSLTGKQSRQKDSRHKCLVGIEQICNNESWYPIPSHSPACRYVRNRGFSACRYSESKLSKTLKTPKKSENLLQIWKHQKL